jgi:prepilin-type N-terminal cleavage/methylation domain-containing protein/prepilin-type processing-associated H-X9-DG protein
MSNKRHGGFTLIELLVVIAIIAILAAILFPVFARARSHARSTKCLSNLKQIGEAFSMYRNDYEERFPLRGPLDPNLYPSLPPAGQGLTFIDFLQPYVKNENIFYCPETDENPKIWKDMNIDYKKPTQVIFKYQYAMNALLCGEPISKVEVVADCVLCWDCRQVLDDSDHYNDYGVTVGWVERLGSGTNITWNDYRYLAKRHSDGANYAFADGHSEYKKDLHPSYWMLTVPE